MSATPIDNIYTSQKDVSKIKSGIIEMDISDHLPVFSIIGQAKRKYRKYESYSYRPLNSSTVISNLKGELQSTDWTFLENQVLNEAYNAFHIKLQEIIDIYAPIKTVKLSNKYIKREKWMTKGLLNLSNTLRKLYKRQLRKPPNHPDHLHFITYRNSFIKLNE